MNNSTGGVKNRRKSALNRLEKQLIKGTKNGAKGNNIPFEPIVDLTEFDVKRIKREIETLKTKI